MSQAVQIAKHLSLVALLLLNKIFMAACGFINPQVECMNN